MEYLCSDQLWDQNLTWGNHRPYPMFTECFQVMVLGTIPSLWLLATFPIYLYILNRTKDHVMKRSWLYHSKMGLVIVQSSLRCNNLLNMFMDVNEAGTDVNIAHCIAECMELVALIVTLVLIEIERKKNYVTSFVLTLYWSIASVCGMIIFYCKFMEPKIDVSVLELVTIQSVLACSITQFILICFPDPSFILPGERPSAIARSSFVSRVLYIWAQKYVVCGYTRSLEDDDFDKLADEDKCATAGSNLVHNWEREKKRHQNDRKTYNKVSLFRVLCRTYARDLICSNCLRVIDLATHVCRYVIVGYIIEFADDISQPTWKAFVFTASLLLLNLIAPVNFNYISFQCSNLAKRMRSALDYMIFQKCLTMTNRSRTDTTVGDMTNLLTQDVEHLKRWIAWIWILWSVPVEFIFYSVLLYSVVGYGVFAALLVLVVTLPLNTYWAKRRHAFCKERVNLKDERIKILTEIINGIKILKFYAWEFTFGDKVLQIRDKEMKILMKEKLLGIIMCMLFGIAPYFMAFSALATYVYFDDNHMLTARTAFMALSIFGGFSSTFSSLPNIWSHYTMAFISMKRLDEFFNKDDIDRNDITHEKSVNTVSINRGRFTWDPNLGVCLKEIQINVAKGSLVAIVGRIGCGKSSMLSAILGEMKKNNGTVNIDGSIAYVPQVAWIQNATLKKNILFGEKERSKIYNDIIEACSLDKDLEILPDGDQTEIGEKGVNLSGGQKQRVSLARAVYSNADIYLLDDPLSAVDAHVGKHIFEQVIGTSGLLRNKTRILVTHSITWLPYVDMVIVMDNGHITEQGQYNDLMNNEGHFAQFIKEYSLNKSDGKLSSDDDMEFTPSMNDCGYMSVNSMSDTDENLKAYDGRIITKLTEQDGIPKNRKPMIAAKRSISRAISHEDGFALSNKIFTRVGERDQNGVMNHTSATAGKQMDEDEIEFGNVKIRHLKTYLFAVGPWYCVVGFSAFIMSRVVEMLGDYNIRNWTSDAELKNLTSISNDSEYRQQQNAYYMTIHAFIGFTKLLYVSCVRLIFALRVTHAAGILHRKLLHNVLRGPMSFFDRTPVGRIIQRFSSDLEPLDGQLYEEGLGLMDNLLQFLQVLFVITFTLPEFFVILSTLGIAYYYIQKYYVPTRQQLSRMRSKRTAPIISHFSETLNGTSVIRAFSKQQHFIRESANKVDYYHELEFMDNAIERWLDVRLHFLNAAFISGAVLLAICNRKILTGSMLGLVLRTAELLSASMHGFVRKYGQFQIQVVCLEKLDQYTTKKTEAATHTSVKPSDIWPAKGEIKICGFSLRYKEDQPLILKGIDMYVHHGEKIGIVGRTGAGKSSLTLGLFRLIEATEGSITIDDHDISELGLFDLRSQLTILPQDPVLFSGTLKDNLDPHGNHSDAIIYDALQHAHLKPFVDSLPDKLDYQCGEGGHNLSVGQRQLICLARSLLRKSKVLVLDEATSAVDMATDELIQTTLKEEFKDCTVLTIAHRLNTIMDYDRILVLDLGMVKQFDKPEILLAHHDGIFYQMAKDAGLV